MRLMKWFKDNYLTGNTGYTVLDIGSRVVTEGHQCYRTIFPPPDIYLGMDVEPGPNVDIVGYESLQTYDVVISGQTIEHIKRPWEWLKGITKYFTKYICIIAPHDLQEHRFPIDCYRFMPDGMRDVFEYAGIEEVQIIRKARDTMGIGKHK